MPLVLTSMLLLPPPSGIGISRKLERHAASSEPSSELESPLQNICYAVTIRIVIFTLSSQQAQKRTVSMKVQENGRSNELCGCIVHRRADCRAKLPVPRCGCGCFSPCHMNVQNSQ